jgi:hypothetical protein
VASLRLASGSAVCGLSIASKTIEFGQVLQELVLC